MPIDYKKYPSNWKTEIVPAVLARANDCCEQCGLKNKELVLSAVINGVTYWRSYTEAGIFGGHRVKTVKVILTVSHIDHDEHNHEVKLDRLKALCQLCHLRYDTAEKKRRKLSKQQ
jgi:hypothetical protein